MQMAGHMKMADWAMPMISLEMCVDAELDRGWRFLEDANDIPLEAELNTQLQLYNSSFSTDCPPRPSWVPMNQTAAALAQLACLPSRDFSVNVVSTSKHFIEQYLQGRAGKPSAQAPGDE